MFRVLREEVPPSSFPKKSQKEQKRKTNDAIFKRESNPCVRLTDQMLPLTYESYAAQRDGSEL